MKAARVRYLALLLSVLYLSLIFILYKSLKSLSILEGQEFPGRIVPLPGPIPAEERTSMKNEVQFNFKRAPGLAHEKDLIQSLAPQSQSNGEAIGRNMSDHEDPTRQLYANRSTEHWEGIGNGEVRGGASHAPPSETWPLPNYCLHAFYYMWYANVTIDGEYKHWNHQYLPHWDSNVDKRYRHGRHQPPDDIGASFYPLLGSYSSRDKSIMEIHMQQLRRAGIGVAAVSWYPPDQNDDNGLSPDPHIPLLLDIAHKYSIKVTFHSEPYSTRSPLSFRRDLKYIHEHYSNHPALLKVQSLKDKTLLPLVYVYDSYLFSAQQWAQVLSAGGEHTIRGTPLDCVAIALLVDNHHKQFVLNGGFDGLYTYFASDGFSYGSQPRHWPALAAFGRQHGLLFIPSAGPGYDDTRVRAWNAGNTKHRRDGDYYKHMMSSAVESNSGIVSITSFNEWHEGTQIEPAVPKQAGTYRYHDYLPHTPEYYLDLTAPFSVHLKCSVT